MKGTITQPADIWGAFVGDQYGGALHSALTLLMLVPAEVLAEGIDRINHEEAIGPMLNPTAYLDGRRWRNAREYKQVLSAALTLRRLLPEMTTEEE